MIEGCVHRKWPDLRTMHISKIQQTWRTPIAKATEPPPSDYDWLLSIADQLLPTVREAFIQAVMRLRNSFDAARLRVALESGNVDTVLAELNLDAAIPATLGPALTAPLEDGFAEAGRAAPSHVPPALTGGQMQMRFDLTRPESTTFLRQYDMGLIKQVSDDTRSAIRTIVQNAMQYGGHPTQQAKQIKSMIGLLPRQAQAVSNYRGALEEEGRSADQVDRMADKYSDRLLRLRAETIARTETLRSSNQGQLASWKQAQSQGLLRSTFRAQWLVTPDDRLCVYCAAVPAMNIGGVALGGMFNTPLGPVMCPPLHPNCRCILVPHAI